MAMRIIPWEQYEIDWSQPNTKIAEKYNLALATVSSRRRKLGVKPTRKFTDWAGTDWTQPDGVIAMERGVTRHAVQMARHRLAKGVKAIKPRRAKPYRYSKKAEIEAKLSERKTVHEWLNVAGIPSEENGKPICLLRRLRILLDDDAIRTNRFVEKKG